MRRRVIGRLRVASRITARMRRWSRSLARLAGVHKSRSMPLGHTATGHRDDVDVVAGLCLRPGQVVHMHLDAAESGKVGVGDVENPHSHRPASDLANREPLTSAYTLVAFHAHPDDEALFTGGTLARSSAEGHRVVVVTATAGELGLTGAGAADLGATRSAELDAAAAALGVARVVQLGYGDPGMDAAVAAPAGSLCAAPVGEVAERLAAVLAEERADAVTIYDAHGGYGHRDHVRIHEAGLLAAKQAGTRLVLEATVARESLQHGDRLPNRLGERPGGMPS